MEGDVPWWISICIGAVSAGAVTIVERVVSRYFDTSSRRQAQREADAEITKHVCFEIRDLAKDYWSKNGQHPLTEAAITGRMLFVSRTVDTTLANNEAALREAQVLLNAFDESCTGGKFGSRTRTDEPLRLSQIEAAVYSLIHHVANASRKP